MVAFPARDERRDEVPAQGEMSPQVRRALQVANAARARAARIRAESEAIYGAATRPPGPARLLPAPAPHAPSPADFAASAPIDARPAPAAATSVPAAGPADLERSEPAASMPDPTEPLSTVAAPSEAADASPEPVGPAEVEPALPPASASNDAEALSTTATEAPAQLRFARTHAAIESDRLWGWAIEPMEAAPGKANGPRPPFGGTIGADGAVASAPDAEVSEKRRLPESLGQISPGHSRRPCVAEPKVPGKDEPTTSDYDPPPGASVASPAQAHTRQRTTAAPETGHGPARPAGRSTSAARTSARAAYRSVRNSVALTLGVVIGAVLLVGLRGDGTMDVVRSVWSMKPPRLVTVERMLTLDLPPFQEVVEVADPPELKVAEPREVRTAETTPQSNGVGAGVLDLVESAAGNDPRVADLAVVVRRDPSRWDAFYRLGHVMQSRGDLAAAERLYRQAVSLNPRHAAMAYDLGYALQRQGDLQGAVEQYRAALALEPDYVYALYNLGTILRRQGAYTEAADLLERAVGLQSDNPNLYYEWGRTLEVDGRFEQAIDAYRQAVALSPDRWPGPDARARMQALLSERPASGGSRS